MSRSEVTETLYDAYGQRFSVDEIYFESRTEHQHLLIFHNAKFGRVMTLDGVVQTTERDEFFYHARAAARARRCQARADHRRRRWWIAA